MTTTIDHPADMTGGPVDPATDMLRSLLARNLDDLLNLAGLLGEVDGGHITAQTIGGAR